MTNAEARFNKSHIRKVYECLAVTCHLHFWRNDRDFLRATVVTRWWNGYRISTESRPWRRKFSRCSSRDSNPRPFNHESGALTTELSPPPRCGVTLSSSASSNMVTVNRALKPLSCGQEGLKLCTDWTQKQHSSTQNR